MARIKMLSDDSLAVHLWLKDRVMGTDEANAGRLSVVCREFDLNIDGWPSARRKRGG
jgi:hypothetical protein